MTAQQLAYVDTS